MKCKQSHLFSLGLPLREMLERFGHKVVQLFKLILLQKRVLFFHSPVRPLTTSILALLALFPGVVETGLDNCTALASQPDSVVVESVEVPKQFIPPPEEPETSTTESQQGIVNGLTEKLSSWKDKFTGGTKTTPPQNTDTTDDTKTSRESSFEDLRAPTAQEMENEVHHFGSNLFFSRVDFTNLCQTFAEVRTYLSIHSCWPAQRRLRTAPSTFWKCKYKKDFENRILFTFHMFIY